MDSRVGGKALDASRHGGSKGARFEESGLRVLHVMEATIGGTRRHLKDVVLAQAAAGFDVHVIAAAERMPQVREDFEAMRAVGAQVEELAMQRSIRPRIDWLHQRHLARRLREIGPSVVHSHSSKAGVLARSASIQTGIGARVHTPHTFAFLFGAMFSPGKRALFRSIEAFLGKRTERIVAVSESEAETIRRSGVVPADRVRTVPNGIDPAPYRRAAPLERSRIGFRDDQPLLVTVGLLNAAKGQDLALEALAECQVPGLQLALVGHGEDQPKLTARLEELGLGERVRLLGWRDDVPALLRCADGLLLPSRWEGMPYAVLEAMAAGLPVLASAVDGARELVIPGQTGWLCPVADVPAMASMLQAFVETEPGERRRLGQAGAERLEAHYSLDRLVEGLGRVYLEAVELHGRSRA